MKATWIHGETGRPVAVVEIDLSGDLTFEGLGLAEDYYGKRHGYILQDGYRYELTEEDYAEALGNFVFVD